MRAKLLTMCLLLGLAGPVLAGGIGLPESLPDTSFTLAGRFPVQVHGSLSGGYLQTTDNNIYGLKSEDGTFQFNEVTLNATIALTDSLTIGAQGLSRDFGVMGNNELSLDWAYADYNFCEQFGVRVGRVKLALGMYGDMWDIDAARIGAFLPMSTYLPLFRDMYSYCDGVQIYGSLSLGPAGELSYHAFLGEQRMKCDGSTLDYSVAATAGGLESTGHYKMRDFWGGRVTWTTPIDGLSLSGSLQHSGQGFTWDVEPTPFMAPFLLPIVGMRLEGTKYTTWYVGGEYTRNDWTLSCEVTGTELEMTQRGKIPGLGFVDLGTDPINRGGVNVQLSRYWNDRLETAVGYGAFFEDWHERWDVIDGVGRKDAYFAAKVPVTDYLVLKGEVHYMDGPHSVDPAFNPAGTTERRYWLFVFKSTLSF